MQCTDSQRPGELFVPIHWTDQISSGGRTGLLSGSEVDPVSGQPAFKNIRAQISPARIGWQACLVTTEPVGRKISGYWTRSRIENGWLLEFAGDGLRNNFV